MDRLLKVVGFNDTVRCFICETTDTVNEAINRNDTYPSASDCLGKVLTVSLMMGANLKGSEELTVKVNGNGPIGLIVCDATSNGVCRGYCQNPHVNFVNNKGGLNTEFTLGIDGVIEVVKDLKLKDFFTSQVPLQTANLAYDFSYYFTVSEQTPSQLALGSLIDVDNKAKIFGGILIQLLPNTPEEVICKLESKLGILQSFSKLLLSHSLEEIVAMIFEDDYRILNEMPLMFKCKCSKESFRKGLKTLGKDTINEILINDNKAECVCHYCKEVYNFDSEDLKQIISEMENGYVS